jgi:hypothetical protein
MLNAELMVRTIHFSCIGGAHHFLHLAPVMDAMVKTSKADVTAFVASNADGTELSKILHHLNRDTAPQVKIITMKTPSWLFAKWRNSKFARLLFWNTRLKSCDALIAAERTSTILRRLPAKCPVMIHIPHGAGDRQKGFERRIALFDYVITGGNKDRDRMIAMNLVSPDACFVSGYIKLSGVMKMNQGRRVSLFANERPVILYNPHFDARLSSWHSFGIDIIDAIIRDGRFNLIIAPHVRLFENAPKAARDALMAKARTDHVIVDTGSDKSMDMTYTMAADIYLGDVSSQIYEFMARPRPAVFVNSHGADWRDNPDYLMWTAGNVIDDISALIPTLDKAAEDFSAFEAVQKKLVYGAFGDTQTDAAETAAQIILRLFPD